MTEIRQVLREVDTADRALRLSGTGLMLLAAAAPESRPRRPGSSCARGTCRPDGR